MQRLLLLFSFALANQHPAGSRLSRRDFTFTEVTFRSVVVNWDSKILKEKGVEELYFVAKSDDESDISSMELSNVESETVKIASLQPSKRYILSVSEGDWTKPSVVFAKIDTLPNGKYEFLIV